MVLNRLVISYKDVHNMLLKFDELLKLAVYSGYGQRELQSPSIAMFVHPFMVVNCFMEVTGVCMQTRPNNIKVSNIKYLQCPVVVRRVLWIFRSCWLASHCWLIN